MIQLAGGWGYNNLGDEAILAGYLEHFGQENIHSVASVNVARTMNSQDFPATVRPETSFGTKFQHPTLIAGGGFLNGNWRREIHAKLWRLNSMAGTNKRVVHGVEIRRLNHVSTRHQAVRLLRGAEIAVRDEKSADEVESLKLPRPTVLPDAISLLYPHLGRYIADSPIPKGSIVLNLLDLQTRNDASEAEVPLSHWRKYCESLLRHLGSRAVVMCIGGGDYRFATSLGPVRIFRPRSVTGLISALAHSEGLVSVRMHPALLGTALGIPTVSIPYCGKVRPTLTRLGLERVITEDLDPSTTLARLSSMENFANNWTRALDENARWLSHALGGVVQTSAEGSF